MDREFVGALLRPHSQALRLMMRADSPPQDIFDAAREAGRQLVRDGGMASETLAQVSRELLSLDAYIQSENETALLLPEV